ncbi:MAG: hypothetical protein EAY81_09140 [Bacteroidetes bacterium]|nr:MAG: hypothetical protein EAY81_09140 [Bacteroidota bacterium]
MLTKPLLNRFILFSLLIIVGSCAQIVNPTGGAKDDKPPVVTETKPDNQSTLFNKNKIIIRFDEFIQLNNPDDQIIISPPLGVKPTFVNKGKTLEISIKDSIQSNTTYTINFGNSIGDNKENNLLSGFSYVFSTGLTIDSNKVQGILQQAFNNKPEKDFTIGLYAASGFIDSFIYHKKPLYLTKTDDLGHFSIYNLPPDSFKLIAFKDDNKNLKYDKNEEFAYYSKSIRSTDTVKYLLRSYKPDPYKPGKIIDTFSIENNKVVIVAYKPYNFLLKELQQKALYVNHIKQTTGIDTFYAYTTDYAKDSLIRLSLSINDTTHALSVKNRSLLKSAKFSFSSSKQLDLGDSIRITFNAPLLRYDTSRILILKDSLKIKYKISQHSPFEMTIFSDWEEKSSYQFKLLDSAFTSVYDDFSTKNNQLYSTKTFKDYASLVLHVKLKHPNKHQYILQLTDVEEKNISYQYIVKKEQDITIQYVTPRVYQVKIIYDANNNGIWDNGDYARQIQPEKVTYHTDTISLKAYWDLEQSVLID